MSLRMNEPNYKMSPHRSIVLRAAGANPELIVDCKSDRIKYETIGVLMILISLFAGFAGGYASTYIFDKAMHSVIFGLGYAVLIFSLDRMMVVTMDFAQDGLRPLLIRIGLACFLSFGISIPVKMRFFQGAIEAQLITMKDQQIKDKADTLRAKFKDNIAHLTTKQKNLVRQQADAAAAVEAAESIYLGEIDGSAGTRDRGIGIIAKEKKDLLRKKENEFAQAAAAKTSFDKKLEQAQKKFDAEFKGEMAQFQATIEKNQDFMVRYQAMAIITSKSPHNKAKWFFILLFLLLEVLPVFVKSMVKNGAYQELMPELKETEKDISRARMAKTKEVEIHSMAVEAESDKEFTTT